MAGPDSCAPSSWLGKGEKFLITGQLPDSLGPWALHTGGIYGKRREGRDSVRAPFQKELNSFGIVAWACQVLEKDWGKKLRMDRKRKLCRRVREVSRNMAGQGRDHTS